MTIARNIPKQCTVCTVTAKWLPRDHPVRLSDLVPTPWALIKSNLSVLSQLFAIAKLYIIRGEIRKLARTNGVQDIA